MTKNIYYNIHFCFDRFLAVPRVYEKMHEKIVAVGASRGSITRSLAMWAKEKALTYHLARMNGYALLA